MSNPYPGELLDANPASVGLYRKCLINHYSLNTEEDMVALRVVKACLMKNIPSKSQHESLRIELKDRKGKQFYIYFERQPSFRPVTPEAPVQTTSSPGQEVLPSETSGRPFSGGVASAQPLLSSNSVSKQSEACDTVTSIANYSRSPSEDRMVSLEFDEDKSPPLYEVAVLADTLHSSATTYHLLTNNCFFYAGLLFDLLKEQYTPKEIPEEPIPTKRRQKAGSWNNHIRLYEPASKESIQPIIDSFKANLLDFENEVHKHHEGREEARKELEKAEADAKVEAQRRKAAENKAEEEAKKRMAAEAKLRALEDSIRMQQKNIMIRA